MSTSTMQERAANGLDPISGRPAQVVWPISTDYKKVAGKWQSKPVDATGREVTVSDVGDWVYAA